MKVVNCPDIFIGSPHPWVVFAHFGLADGNDFFKEHKKYYSEVPGTIINASGYELDDDNGLSEQEYRLRTEWRLIAMDAADYILIQSGDCIESASEIAIYAKTGKLYVVRNMQLENEQQSFYYDYIFDLFRIPQLDSPIRLIQVLKDATSHEEKRPLF